MCVGVLGTSNVRDGVEISSTVVGVVGVVLRAGMCEAANNRCVTVCVYNEGAWRVWAWCGRGRYSCVRLTGIFTLKRTVSTKVFARKR